jgi:hypothetical protein
MEKSVINRLLLFSAFLLLLLYGCATATRFIFSPGTTLADPPAPVGFHYQTIWFEATDKTKLHGWLVPGDPAAPMVLFFHGNAANITHRAPNIAYLHKLGLNVFIFDYRGFGKSNGTPLREEDLYKDARGALLFLKGIDWNGKRLIYYGRSMGATVALQMALEQPPAGIILECPFTSLPDIATLTNPISYGLFGKLFIKDHFNNEKKIKAVSTPLLIFHGKKDQITPFEMSIRLYSLGNQPKSLFLVENAGHSDCYVMGGEGYRNSWKSFLKNTTNYTCSF